MAAPFRLVTLLDRRDHNALLYAGDGIAADSVASFEATAQAVRDAAHGYIAVHLAAAPGAGVESTVLPLFRDSRGEFTRLHAAMGRSAFGAARRLPRAGLTPASAPRRATVT